MSESPTACNDLVDSPASWLLWGIPIGLGVIAMAWPPGRPGLLVVAFGWAGLACFANARRCGRFHCHVTGPLYLGLAAVSALTGTGFLELEWRWVAVAFAVGTGIAYVPEFLGWRYVRGGWKSKDA